MRDVSQLVTNFTSTDPNYPDGKFKNDAVPGDNTGSELLESWPNDILGAIYSLIRDAGSTPDGLAEFPGQSQFVDAVRFGQVPVGSIIPFYDFNALVTFDSNVWQYCAGQVISDAESPLNGETMPDLSNRYLVGFGTEAGGDIGTATFATAAVGNANHQVDLQHSHTVNSHTHSLSSHTHSGPSHSHPSGSLQFETGEIQNTPQNTLIMYDSGGGDETAVTDTILAAAGPTNTANVDGTIQQFFTKNGSGSTANAGTGNTGTPSNNTSGTSSPGTNNQLSTTQSIQPRSIRVRFIMKIK